MFPSLQRSSPGNPFGASQPATSLNPLTVLGKPPADRVIWAADVVQAAFLLLAAETVLSHRMPARARAVVKEP